MTRIWDHDPQPLSAGVWTALLADLLHDCIGSAPAEQADRIREALALFARAPWECAAPFAALPDPAAIEAMLAAGAPASAAMALLGPDCGFMLSRGGHDVCLATVALTGSDEDVTAEGTTPALALLAARLSALLVDAADARVAAGANSPGASLRLN